MGKPASRIAMQGRRGASDFPGMDTYSCSACQITYHHPQGRKATCPLCLANQEIKALSQQLVSLQQAMDLLSGDLERERRVNSMLAAMRDAVPLMSFEDLATVKSAAYRWREDRTSIVVSAMRRAGMVEGFALKVKGQDPEHHHCNSVGGLALATCYAEATKMNGSVKAMELLLRALAWHLSDG